ncbi:MAG: hypothetical protein ACXAD7_13270 [Candidatus Kariarchaeaceae archaeon]
MKIKISSNFEKSEIFLSMAGSGDPWSAITNKSKFILSALHEELSIKETSEVLNMTVEQISIELKKMEEANLVKRHNDRYLPTFFVSNLNETEEIYNHSVKTGKILAETLLNNWTELKEVYTQLSISKSHPLGELSFMLIGSRILDIGLLGALTKDKTLLQPAPLRPSLEDPGAHYYFWMIEGEYEYLGKYGQDDTDLPWSNWHLLTFGQSWIDGKSNKARNLFEETSEESIQKMDFDDPESFAKEINVPFLNREDSMLWDNLTEKIAAQLVVELKKHKTDLINFYNTLRVSEYAPASFGEFMCDFVFTIE